MTDCSTGRRGVVRGAAVLGLALLGSMALGGPAAAQGVAPGPTPTTPGVDLLTSPLKQVTDAVRQATSTVVQQIPPPAQQPVTTLLGTNPSPTPPKTGPKTGTGTGSSGPRGGQTLGLQTTPQATTTQRSTSSRTATSAPAPAAVDIVRDVAPAPDVTGTPSGPDGGSPSAVSATATDPLSLFGAPQVASPSRATDVPVPLSIRPAGGSLDDLLPIGTPEAVPAALAATACAVVATAAVAQIVAVRRRLAAS